MGTWRAGGRRCPETRRGTSAGHVAGTRRSVCSARQHSAGSAARKQPERPASAVEPSRRSVVLRAPRFAWRRAKRGHAAATRRPRVAQTSFGTHRGTHLVSRREAREAGPSWAAWRRVLIRAGAEPRRAEGGMHFCRTSETSLGRRTHSHAYGAPMPPAQALRARSRIFAVPNGTGQACTREAACARLRAGSLTCATCLTIPAGAHGEPKSRRRLTDRYT